MNVRATQAAAQRRGTSRDHRGATTDAIRGTDVLQPISSGGIAFTQPKKIFAPYPQVRKVKRR
jgi:energy-converting hydrogenase Eha subunit F